MKTIVSDIMGRFGPIGRTTTAFGTVATRFIPPWPGPLGSSPFLYSIDAGGRPNWFQNAGRTVLSSILYTTAGTAHVVTLMRPLNFARIVSAVAPAGTTITIDRDPGVYATNYRYPNPLNTGALGYGQGSARLASNVIATGDYVAFQLADGTWHYDTVTVSGLVLTPAVAIPNVTGGGIAANSPLFWFGVTGDSDPATGLAHPGTLTIASTDRVNLANDDVLGFCGALHPGDPLILISDNATATGTFQGVSGYYSRF